MAQTSLFFYSNDFQFKKKMIRFIVPRDKKLLKVFFKIPVVFSVILIFFIFTFTSIFYA